MKHSTSFTYPGIDGFALFEQEQKAAVAQVLATHSSPPVNLSMEHEIVQLPYDSHARCRCGWVSEDISVKTKAEYETKFYTLVGQHWTDMGITK